MYFFVHKGKVAQQEYGVLLTETRWVAQQVVKYLEKNDGTKYRIVDLRTVKGDELLAEEMARSQGAGHKCVLIVSRVMAKKHRLVTRMLDYGLQWPYPATELLTW